MVAVAGTRDRLLHERRGDPVSGLRKRYGDMAAVDGVDLDIHGARCSPLLGPNGAGKTTTVEILEGYRRRDGGEVARARARTRRTATAAWRPGVGIVLQDDAGDERVDRARDGQPFRPLLPDPRDPDEVIDAGRPGGEARAPRSRSLSGGQRRRLDVALGVIGRPGAAVPGRADDRLRPARRGGSSGT